MASMQQVKAGRHTYYRIVESRRVHGKPRPIPLLHLGTADQLLNRLLPQTQPRCTLRSYQQGDVAALKAMADRLGLVALIDQHCPASRRSLSLGTPLVLAALHRAVWPCSQRAWATWAQRTSVHRLCALQPAALTSQDCWDQMDAVAGLAVEAIEADRTRQVVHDFPLQLDTLFYDTSNFFTSLARGTERATLAQRGHSKHKRFALRQLSLALLVTRDGQIPLYADVYEGNTVDATRFPTSLTAIRHRVEHLVGHLADLTRVYDKGKNAKAQQALVDDLPVHYVASLVPSQHPDLTALPTTAYTPIGSGPLAKLPVYRCQRTIWGAERTVILFLSSTLRPGHIRGLHQHLHKRLDALQQWHQTLAKPRSGPRTVASAQTHIERWLTGQSLRPILPIVYDPQRPGAERLTWWIDHAALTHLETAGFGKRLLITDQHTWSTEEIILAYRGQSRAEAVFRPRKDVDHLAVRPQYHGTDQKMRVHTFICLVALLLCRLVERECRGAGYQGSLSSLLDLLSTIRLALVLWPADTPKGHPRCTWLLEDCAPEAWQLYQRLVPPVPPFGYTSSTT